MNLRRIFSLFVAAAVGIGILVYVLRVPPQTRQTPVRSETQLPDTTIHNGIDVSYHSGNIHWPTVAEQGFSFAFIKATEGDDFKDSTFDSHWEQLRETGLVRGAYHFYVTEDDPDSQAAFFIRNVALEPGDLAPVVDIELIGHGTSDGLTERFRRFLDAIEGHYGIKPIIYTSPTFWDKHLSVGFGDYPLWVAEYEVDEPRIPSGWDTWHLWQWAGDTLIAGVEKGADITRLNRAAVRLADLRVVAR